MRTSALCFLLVPAVLAVAHGCDDGRFQAPCRVRREDVLVADPSIGTRPSVALRRAKDRALAVWARRDLPDAGDAGAPLLTSLEIANVDVAGHAAARVSVAVPDPLLARRGSVDAFDVLVEDQAFAAYWVETTTTTSAEGRVRTTARVKVAYAVETAFAKLGPATKYAEPIDVTTCERCLVAAVSLPTESIFVVGTDLERDAPSFRAFRVRRDGTSSEILVPWLQIPAPLDAGTGDAGAPGVADAGDAELDLFVDGDARITLRALRHAWLLDAATFAPVAGPVELPLREARIAWERASTEATVAWSISPFDDGRASADVAPNDLFTGNVPRGFTMFATRERVTRGRSVLALDRMAGEVGVVFESAGRTFFSAVDARGKKRGGDVLVRPAPPGANTSELGRAPILDAHLLFAGEGGRHTLVTFGSGSLVVTEVACEAP